MTVGVSLVLPEGVILGVDSAVTFGGKNGVLKVYENAQKLFQLSEKPVGISCYGMASIGNRTIGSYLREFEILDPNKVVSSQSNVKDIVEELRVFLMQKYQSIIIPALQQEFGKPYEQIPDDKKPILGLAVGGFSSGCYLPELWEILIPIHNQPNSAKFRRKQGSFGSDWFAVNEAIIRYIKGFDGKLIDELVAYFVKIKGTPLTQQEEKDVSDILGKFEYQIPFPAMPLDEGIAFVRFLVDMVINHHRFAVGAPVVGGKARIGLVTYKGENFHIL